MRACFRRERTHGQLHSVPSVEEVSRCLVASPYSPACSLAALSSPRVCCRSLRDACISCMSRGVHSCIIGVNRHLYTTYSTFSATSNNCVESLVQPNRLLSICSRLSPSPAAPPPAAWLL